MSSRAPSHTSVLICTWDDRSHDRRHRRRQHAAAPPSHSERANSKFAAGDANARNAASASHQSFKKIAQMSSSSTPRRRTSRSIAANQMATNAEGKPATSHAATNSGREPQGQRAWTSGRAPERRGGSGTAAHERRQNHSPRAQRRHAKPARRCDVHSGRVQGKGDTVSKGVAHTFLLDRVQPRLRSTQPQARRDDEKQAGRHPVAWA